MTLTLDGWYTRQPQRLSEQGFGISSTGQWVPVRLMPM